MILGISANIPATPEPPALPSAPNFPHLPTFSTNTVFEAINIIIGLGLIFLSFKLRKTNFRIICCLLGIVALIVGLAQMFLLP